VADTTQKPDVTQPTITLPGLGAVPVVAIRLPDGTIALRHPSELTKNVAPLRAPGGAT
jgi:hypothetical protein